MERKGLYIARLFRHSKLLFACVLIFSFFQLYFNYKRIHSFPWFVWDMYSRVETLPDTLVQTEVFIDGQRLDVTRLPIWKEATILHTYKMYNWQKMNNDNDPMDALVKERTRFFPQKVYYYAAYKINNHGEENNRYPQWLKKYLEKQLGKKIATVELKDVQYKYANGQFMPLNSWTVLKIDH